MSAPRPARSELDQLHEMYDARGRGSLSTGTRADTHRAAHSRAMAPAASRARAADITHEMSRSAATSHHRNDQYVRDLAAAYGHTIEDDSHPHTRTASATGRSARSVGVTSVHATTTAPGSRPRMRTSARCAWERGPVDPSGVLLELSERPVLCVATHPHAAEVVLGSSDHASYVIDLLARKKSRTLYGRTAGHTEWVTGATYTGDGSGRIATCGMDGKIILWHAAGRGRAGDPATSQLLGHFGSVAAVVAPGVPPPTVAGPWASCFTASPLTQSLLVSAGYDKTIRVWDTVSCSQVQELRGHRAPVMHLCLRPAADDAVIIASGDRDGVVCLWDGTAGTLLATLRGHAGQISALTWMLLTSDSSSGITSAFILSGAQDGHLRVWRLADATCAMNCAAHTSASGSGAVSDIAVTLVGDGPVPAPGAVRIVTAGADKHLCVFEPAADGTLTLLHRLTEHRDFIYSLHVTGKHCFSGAGDGMMICHDIVDGRPRWGLGANTAAVRAIATFENTMLVSGDDGKALLFEFSAG